MYKKDETDVESPGISNDKLGSEAPDRNTINTDLEGFSLNSDYSSRCNQHDILDNDTCQGSLSRVEVMMQPSVSCDSDTQGDVSGNLNCPITSQPVTTLQNPCFWSNSIPVPSIQQNFLPVYPHPVYPPTGIFPVPNYNPQLPFPDKSGDMPHMGYGMHQAMPTASSASNYPTVYISAAGLITVLLKYDVAVELTIDKNIRVVNHRHRTVAACNSRGSTNCVYHVAAKIYQEGTRTEVEAFGERRARMQTEGILFSSGMEVYLLNENHIVPSQFCFNDMSKDCSVNILFGSTSEFSHDLLLQCEEITKNSRYYFHKNGSMTIIINNIKIHQDEYGEVRVTSGPKFITTSPIYGNIYVQTHFVEISVQANWNVRVKRGCHYLNASYTSFAVSDSDHEAGFDQFREVFSRSHNAIVSEFESWLPSLTFLCQALPQMKASRAPHSVKSYRSQRNWGAGDQITAME